MEYNQLTSDERYVILEKGTEAPFSGRYYKHSENGTYLCRQCNAPLFISEAKFDAGCGWPSFDDQISGSVKLQLDKDGKRTEIVCAKCGGHLGHVFFGEQFTQKDTRYCVNSISLEFEAKKKDLFDTAYFAGGCFWGVEYYLQKAKGVVKATSGYMGGNMSAPTYEDVCAGETGHAETVEVVFDTEQTDYETLAKLFFEIHDFTQINRQGPDIGTQYRSAIFYMNDYQKETIQKLISELTKKGYKVATEVIPAAKFWEAEKYHQEYYFKKGSIPYCHSRRKIF